MKKVSAVNRSNSAKISHNGNGTTANSNRFLPNSLKFIASCIKTVSSNVKSAGASVAGSISGDSSDDLLKDQVYKTIFFPFEIYWVSEFIFFHLIILVLGLICSFFLSARTLHAREFESGDFMVSFFWREILYLVMIEVSVRFCQLFFTLIRSQKFGS